MKLITETTFDWGTIQDVKQLKEEKNGVPEYYIEGVYMQANVQNANKRVYPKQILMKEVQRYNKEMVKTKRSVGELGHPTNPTVNMDRVSHMIVQLRENDNNVIGKAKILSTLPMGAIVTGLIEEGVQFGVSSRGLGSVQKSKDKLYEIVQDDFSLRAVDIVHDPSAPDAFVNGIMEGVEWIYENGLFKQSDLEAAKKDIEKTSQNQLEEKIISVFDKFLGSLK